jgi:hypothetical protein
LSYNSCIRCNEHGRCSCFSGCCLSSIKFNMNTISSSSLSNSDLISFVQTGDISRFSLWQNISDNLNEMRNKMILNDNSICDIKYNYSDESTKCFCNSCKQLDKQRWAWLQPHVSEIEGVPFVTVWNLHNTPFSVKSNHLDSSPTSPVS